MCKFQRNWCLGFFKSFFFTLVNSRDGKIYETVNIKLFAQFINKPPSLNSNKFKSYNSYRACHPLFKILHYFFQKTLKFVHYSELTQMYSQ
jgi:hypothetical protein